MSPVDLIELVAGDLAGYRLDSRGGGTAVFVSESGGLDFEVSEKVERRFLGRTRVARFEARFSAPGLEDSLLDLGHSGGMRRTGITVGDHPGALGALLQEDEGFVAAATALDFKRFRVAISEGECIATTELVGAALVAIALPPVRSYVRLYPDQREALIRSFEALRRLVAVPRRPEFLSRPLERQKAARLPGKEEG